ncbi:MAG: cardiolipin synthase [Rikenellaceae bacterium]
MGIWSYISLGITIIYFLMVAGAVYTVLFERRDPTKAIAWIVVIIILPVVGMICYIFFGRSFRKRKIFNLKGLKNTRYMELRSQWQIKNIDAIDNENIDPHIDIVKLLLNNSNTPITFNNSVEILNNGSETFDALFDALKQATDHIHLEYYIIDNDDLGNKLSDILCQKAAAGVEVRLLYDDVGCWSLKKSYLRRLKKAGVELRSFMPVVFPYLTSQVNYRNHRKIVVVDGVVGFMGGLNIAQRYLEGNKLGKWRDTHLKIMGDAVRMLQMTFLTDWYAASKKELKSSSRFFPKADIIKGGVATQIALSGPDSDYAVIMQGFFAAISKAKSYIYISTPYFLPGESLLTALKVAALSGIDVRIMLPARSDMKMAHWASRSYFTELLEANIKVYLYEAGFNHSKLMVIDGTFGSIGSANMDSRSFEDNFEITAMIYDRALAEQMRTTYLDDLRESTLLTLSGWEGRKRKDNFKEAAARLFTPLL